MWGNSPTSTVGPNQAPPRAAGKYYSGSGLESIAAGLRVSGTRKTLEPGGGLLILSVTKDPALERPTRAGGSNGWLAACR
jgi:hypothetical protein